MKKNTNNVKCKFTEATSEAPFCLVVGIGASAGGLKALEAFFENLKDASDMAFIIIQHLSSTYKSHMAELLKKHTKFPIIAIEEGTILLSEHIYLNPPNKDVALNKGVFSLKEPQISRGTRYPIDYFFRSLAIDRQDQAVSILLSGTGTDGTLGIEEIKGADGLVIVQDEKQAQYDGMPISAIKTGFVDHILPVEKMPEELVLYRKLKLDASYKPDKNTTQMQNIVTEKILNLLRRETGHDFSGYKKTTIFRRISRRLAIKKIDDYEQYFRQLKKKPEEVTELQRDLLIGVTSFFRNSESFEKLKNTVIIPLLRKREEESEPLIRIWVPGCSTGEEALSIAMLCFEAMDETNINMPFKVFATDLDSRAIERARLGEYPESIANDVNLNRLKRFFTKKDGFYKIKKNIRETVIYASQNIINDPPFSKLDLISCRNVLIYMEQELQKKLFPLFHFALKTDGYLFLGTSETIGFFSQLFEPVDLKARIYIKKDLIIAKNIDYLSIIPSAKAEHHHERKDGEKTFPVSLQDIVRTTILKEFSYPCVVVNRQNDILYFSGDTSQYLSLPTGESTFNIVKIAREGIGIKIGIILHRLFNENGKGSISERILFLSDEGYLPLRLTAKMLEGSSSNNPLAIIVFEKIESAIKNIEMKGENEETEQRFISLEQDLLATKEYLQTAIEELETSNEELKSTNEELQSTNEELQSTNEELETSREELQSTNEELMSVNSELQTKVDELTSISNDINNLLASTEIGTIFLDNSLRIKRFTPSMTKLFNLIGSDVGRPLIDITSKLSYDGLNIDAGNVLSKLQSIEREVRTSDAKHFSMHIHPYKTKENVIDGVVITFVDITKRVGIEKDLVIANYLNKNIINAINEPLLVLDRSFFISMSNMSFLKAFGLTEENVINRCIFDISEKQWDNEKLRVILEDVLSTGKRIESFEIRHTLKGNGKLKIMLDAWRIGEESINPVKVLIIIKNMVKVGKNEKKGNSPCKSREAHQIKK